MLSKDHKDGGRGRVRDRQGSPGMPCSLYGRRAWRQIYRQDNGAVTNEDKVDFDESTADWGKMTHFLIFDAETGGNLLMYGALSVSRTVEEATVMTIKAGSLNLSVVNPAPAA